MKHKTLQDALSEIKPQIKENDVRIYFSDKIINFIDLYEDQIRKIIRYNENCELELYKDIFIRITKNAYQKLTTIGEEKIASGIFYSKNDGVHLDYFLLVNKSDGYNTINWETQKEYFIKNHKEIMNDFMERNRIDG